MQRGSFSASRKGLLAGLALAVVISLWIGWTMRRFDYESGLEVLRFSSDGVHWVIPRLGKEFSVEPYWKYLVEVVLFSMMAFIPLSIVLGAIGYVGGRLRQGGSAMRTPLPVVTLLMLVSRSAQAHENFGGYATVFFLPAVFIAIVLGVVPWFFTANMQRGPARTVIRQIGASLAALVMAAWVLLAVAVQ